ncbi:hypothetical protein [Shewanella algae]|uniref:hypothetical protein n=1 Tax=Shewanella algae TaxID=38313 RepID=UPI0031F58AB8
MSNDEEVRDKRENKFAEAIAEIAHSQMGYYIGFGIFMLAIGIGTRWDGHLFSQKGCIEVQEINEKYFKVNSCSGDVEEIGVEKAKELKSEEANNEKASNK